MIARVLVNLKNEISNDLFDYLIPDELIEHIYIGSRVIVPFGFQDISGYVLEVVETSDYTKEPKSIKEIFSYEKEITTDQIELAKILQVELNIPLAVSLDLMIPSYLKEKKKKYLYVQDPKALHPTLAMLFAGKKKILYDKELLPHSELIRKEIRSQHLALDYDFSSYGQTKKTRMYRLGSNLNASSAIRKRVLDYMTHQNQATLDELVSETDASRDLIRKMVNDQQLKMEYTFLTEDTLHVPSFDHTYKMNIDQDQLLGKFHENHHKPFLLYSNDETFKINYFIRLIDDFSKASKQVVLFAPTIMLVEEIASYLTRHIQHAMILTYHSKHSTSENYDTFMRIKQDQFHIIVSTPIGVFLPFTKVGCFIVMDEEDPRYIYENYPYYDSREVLKARCELLDSKLILSSSTPSITSYYRALQYQYFLLEYTIQLEHPATIVDMREEQLNNNQTILSNPMTVAMKQALKNQELILLIVNQKGFSTQIQCRSCGEVLQCPKCKIPLTYIQSKDIAKCNYCDYKSDQIPTCKCGSTHFIHLGFGLEQVEQVVTMAFPKARLMKVDSSTVSALEDYTNVLLAIEEKNVDIIIGTNAMTKMLVQNAFGLVGLLHVDGYVHMNDHRGAEYTYQLIAKTALHNRCMIQTYYPDHYAIQYGSKGDFESFYTKEINYRQLLDYEPFYEMNKITITGPYQVLFHFGYYYRKAIVRIIGDRVLGPSYDYKVRGVKLIIKHQQYSDVVKVLNDAIKNFNQSDLNVRFERYPRGM